MTSGLCTTRGEEAIETIDRDVKPLLLVGKVITGGEDRSRRMAVIDRLPWEVLVRIIELASRPDGIFRTPDYIPRRRVLTRVCTRWFQVVDGSGQLWTLVNGDRPESEWRVALQKSEHYPIDVRYEVYDKPVPNPPFMRAIMDHSHRWESVIVATPWDEALRLMENVTAPRLTLFGFMVWGPAPPALDVFPRGVVKLRLLTLDNLQIKSWTPLLLSDLMHLDVQGVDEGPAFEQLLDLLHASPNLKLLRLGILRFGGVIMPRVPVFALTRLTELTLQIMTPFVVQAILCSINTPHCRFVYIEFLENAETESALLDTVMTFTTPLLAPRRSSRGALTLSVSLGSVTSTEIAMHDPYSQEVTRFRLRLDNVRVPPDELGSWIDRLRDPLLIGPTIPILVVSVDSFFHGGVRSLAAILYRLKGVGVLFLQHITLVPLFMALAIPSIEDGHLCPDLHHLHLEDCHSPNPSVLIQMLRSRAQLLWNSTVLRDRTPARLASLHIRSCSWMDRQAFNLLEQLLGVGNVDWDGVLWER